MGCSEERRLPRAQLELLELVRAKAAPVFLTEHVWSHQRKSCCVVVLGSVQSYGPWHRGRQELEEGPQIPGSSPGHSGGRTISKSLPSYSKRGGSRARRVPVIQTGALYIMQTGESSFCTEAISGNLLWLLRIRCYLDSPPFLAPPGLQHKWLCGNVCQDLVLPGIKPTHRRGVLLRCPVCFRELHFICILLMCACFVFHLAISQTLSCPVS